MSSHQPVAISADGAPPPTGAFTHGTRWGDLIYTSGQAGRDQATGQMGDLREQTANALAHLRAILEAAGSSMSGVLKTTVYIRDDVTDTTGVNDAYTAAFPDRLPARASVFVSRLKNPDMLVEIEAVAVVH